MSGTTYLRRKQSPLTVGIIRYFHPSQVRIVKFMARGSFGDVYAAQLMADEDEHSGADADGEPCRCSPQHGAVNVAAKSVRPHRAVEELMREILAHARIGYHPHIMPLYGAVPSTKKGTAAPLPPALVFPLMGSTLHDSLMAEASGRVFAQQKPGVTVTEQNVVRALTTLLRLEGLAAAIAHLQAREIVHADVRPPNVFHAADANHSLVLGDMGCACPAGSAMDEEIWEQRRRYSHFPEDRFFTWSYDVFSLGVIALELFFACVIITVRSRNTAAESIGSDTFTRSPHDVVRAASALALACLDPCPEKRPAASDIVVACRCYLAPFVNADAPETTSH